MQGQEDQACRGRLSRAVSGRKELNRGWVTGEEEKLASRTALCYWVLINETAGNQRKSQGQAGAGVGPSGELGVIDGIPLQAAKQGSAHAS